jgi:hypothetical protein
MAPMRVDQIEPCGRSHIPKSYGNLTDREGAQGGSEKPRAGKGTAAYDSFSHARSFLDCFQSRTKCNPDVLVGHMSTSPYKAS